MSKKVAVTGASGHIGNVVCRQLIDLGYQVRAFYHTDFASLTGLTLESVKGSILNLNDIKTLVEGCEYVIHCAAIISIDGDENGMVFKTNTEGVKNVLHGSLQEGVKKIIHVSSVHAVYDLPHKDIYDESRPYKQNQDFAYDYSKAVGEQMMLQAAKENDIEVVVVRPSCVVGPFDFKPSKMGTALWSFYKAKLPVIPQGGYDIVDVRDVAASIITAMTMGENGHVYLLSGKYCSFKEIIQIINEVGNKRKRSIFVPLWVLRISVPVVGLFSKILKTNPSITYESLAAIEEGHPNMNYSKAHKILNHNPRPLHETLKDFFNWMCTNSRNKRL